jgi:hypothetical protein
MPVKEGDKVCVKCGGVNEHRPGCSGENDLEFEVISFYGRKAAIEDGVLVDCTQPPFDELNWNAGIKVHVAMTAEAFHAYVHPLGSTSSPIQTVRNDTTWQVGAASEGNAHLPPGQDMKGRYWDVVSVLGWAMRRHQEDSCVLFRLHVVPNHGGQARLVELKCVAGPDDEGKICLTIMMPDQD